MCTKLCFLRQDEDTIHWPQTLIVNLLPVCYIRSARSEAAEVCWSNRVYEIPNTKLQTNLKFQYKMTKTSLEF